MSNLSNLLKEVKNKERDLTFISGIELALK
jgi:hypothetical protein